MLVLELGGSAIPSIVRDKVKEQNNDRQASHDLQSFSFESISVATRFSFSIFVCVCVKLNLKIL